MTWGEEKKVRDSEGKRGLWRKNWEIWEMTSEKNFGRRNEASMKDLS